MSTSMRGNEPGPAPCAQTCVAPAGPGSAVASLSMNSAATMMCLGATILMQCASEADQIGIEQRHHGADAGDAEPDRHVLRPVRHEQADRFALGETLLQRPAGIPVRALGERSIGQALAVGEEGLRLGA